MSPPLNVLGPHFRSSAEEMRKPSRYPPQVRMCCLSILKLPPPLHSSSQLSLPSQPTCWKEFFMHPPAPCLANSTYLESPRTCELRAWALDSGVQVSVSVPLPGCGLGQMTYLSASVSSCVNEDENRTHLRGLC